MIIGLNGLAKSGKDTFGEYIVTNYEFTRIAFADELKDIASETTGIAKEYFFDVDLKDKPLEVPIKLSSELCLKLIQAISTRTELFDSVILQKDFHKDLLHSCLLDVDNHEFASPRAFLQRLGTDICRKHIDDSIWIELSKEKIRRTKGSIVITDVRFPNEVKLIKELGGIAVKIKRQSVVPVTTSHSSEQNIPDHEFQVIFDNDSTIYDYLNNINLWMSHKTGLLPR
jgi:hypothetical protein